MSLASARDRALEFADRVHVLGPFSTSRFFGGAALAKNGATFAFVMGGVLYLRVDDQNRPEFEARGATPFSYGTRAKTVTVATYYTLPEEIEDDVDELRDWVTRSIRAATLAKRPKRKSSRAGATDMSP